MSSKVIIYGRTNPICPFCLQAKKMAEKAGLHFEYKDLSKNEWSPEALLEDHGLHLRTVPAVFIDDKFIGGAKELSQFIRGNFS